MEGYSYNLQTKLVDAFIKRNLKDFIEALRNGADPLRSYDERNINIYEKVLQTPDCSKFIYWCIKEGCKTNYINSRSKKSAIHFAIDSQDVKNLAELFLGCRHELIDVNYKYQNLTPLNTLVENLNKENFNNIMLCMKILLYAGASLNITDQNGLTTWDKLIISSKLNDSKRLEIIQMFSYATNIDTMIYKDSELAKILKEKFFTPNVGSKMLFQLFLLNIRFHDTNPLNSLEKEKKHKLFNVLLENGTDTAIATALYYGNAGILEKLLEQHNIDKFQPLLAVMSILNIKTNEEMSGHWKCFDVLLKSHKIDINARDHLKSTALHYALKYQNNKAIKDLLKQGACISLENMEKRIPLHDLKPAVLEAHLDYCITNSYGDLHEKNYELKINIKNFIAKKHIIKISLKTIALMEESKTHRYLLQHPVITTILYLKWHKLSLFFFVNCLIYTIFFISMTTQAVLKFHKSNQVIAYKISLYSSYLGLIYLIVRELLQLTLSGLKYFRSITNYLEILLIILSFLNCYEWKNHDLELASNIAVTCLLLMAYELTIMVGSLPISSISTHILMFKAVSKSFFKGFLLYSIFILTFTLCFYIKNQPDILKDLNNLNFHHFPSILMALTKTIIMFTGEFEADQLKLDSTYTYLLFLLFVFFVTIILFNLLNGLAVSDTQAIKNQAELYEIIYRLKFLQHYENIITEKIFQYAYILIPKPFNKKYQELLKFFKDFTNSEEIYILPNQYNKVSNISITHTNIQNKRTKIPWANIAEVLGYEDNTNCSIYKNDIKTKPLDYLYSWFNKKFFSIDQRTVNQAMAILEIRSNHENDKNVEEKLIQIIKQFGIQD